MTVKCSNWIIIIGSVLFAANGETQHKTKAASEKQHDLWCYRCDTMIDGERCLDVTGNYSTMLTKCTKEQKKCQVRRISMSTSTDEVTGKPKLWLLQRNCTENCEPGCIVVGERTKLHSCITCCDEHNFCNSGNASISLSDLAPSKLLLYTVNILYVIILSNMTISSSCGDCVVAKSKRNK